MADATPDPPAAADRGIVRRPPHPRRVPGALPPAPPRSASAPDVAAEAPPAAARWRLPTDPPPA